MWGRGYLLVSVTVCLLSALLGPRAVALEQIGRGATDQHAALEAAFASEEFPYIVLIPGVLGSQIDSCRAAAGPCETIWGSVIPHFDPHSLVYKPSGMYKASLLQHLAWVEVYRPISSYITKLYGRFGLADRLVPIPYDWRANVGKSAQEVGKKVCEIVARDPKAKFAFLAHSMGGLVLKKWMIDHLPQKCGGIEIQVVHAYFVATPHLGSSRSLDAVVAGYNLFLDENDTAIVRFFQRIGDRVFVRSMNQAGLSFEGFFDLLPILSSQSCHAGVTSQDVDIGAYRRDGSPIDIFDAATWDEFRLLSNHSDAGSAQLALPGLQIKLKQSLDLMCPIANFDPSTITDVKYIVGVLPKEGSTVSRLEVGLSNGAPDLQKTRYRGDTTVDVRSASNKGIGTLGQRVISESSHLDIINSEAVKYLVDDLVVTSAQAVFRRLRESAGLDDQYFVDRFAAESALMPFTLDPSAWGDDDNASAIRINQRILEILDIDPNDIYRASRDNDYDVESLWSLTVSALHNATNPANKAGALARAAEAAFVFGDYAAAKSYGALAVAAADDLPRARDRKRISAGAKNTIEKAELKLTQE